MQCRTKKVVVGRGRIRWDGDSFTDGEHCKGNQEGY